MFLLLSISRLSRRPDGSFHHVVLLDLIARRHPALFPGQVGDVSQRRLVARIRVRV
jgi:hypothetical protein